jgi:hypothetical protein
MHVIKSASVRISSHVIIANFMLHVPIVFCLSFLIFSRHRHFFCSFPATTPTCPLTPVHPCFFFPQPLKQSLANLIFNSSINSNMDDDNLNSKMHHRVLLRPLLTFKYQPNLLLLLRSSRFSKIIYFNNWYSNNPIVPLCWRNFRINENMIFINSTFNIKTIRTTNFNQHRNSSNLTKVTLLIVTLVMIVPAHHGCYKICATVKQREQTTLWIRTTTNNNNYDCNLLRYNPGSRTKSAAHFP